MVSVRVLPMGERAFLLEAAGIDEVLAVHAALAATRPEGVVDIVPAARTVLVRVDPRVLALPAARTWATAAAAGAGPVHAADQPLVVLDIVYDGADLAETADLLGVTSDELSRRHSTAEWTVAFTGFAPGFGYLVSADWPFDTPRLSSPRTRVPAGAVGLAGAFTGAYPRETPGGWRLIGTTGARLFDADAASPALLAPGTRVRFRPATGALEGVSPQPAANRARQQDGNDQGRGSGIDGPSSARPDLLPGTIPTPAAEVDEVEGASSQPAANRARQQDGNDQGRGSGIEGPPSARPDLPPGTIPTPAAEADGLEGGGIRIVEPGLLSTLQDLGRPGAASVGVAVSGALDRSALRTANRLLGNPEGAAGIEVTMGGLRAVAQRDLWVAVSGAWGPLRLDGHEIDPYTAHRWRAGAELHVDWFARGARAYLAVRGGLEGRLSLGSRATDLLAGLGPAALRGGDVLAVRDDAEDAIPVADLAPWGAPHDDELELELAPGPRADWFAPDALQTLFDAAWTVSNDADRVGARLDGPELPRARAGELPSEGMVPGALQVPPSGRPTILLADGPVTGGYPVIAAVADAALDLVAQARPGTRIRFRHARIAG
ncbi:urea amidolyase family protein [Microbacterium yannicii]|uniref:urea amidolyase family protein n=1 Tax=Microbacterium yannicii TaxID=671622 RepID=UPI00030C77D9|nr:urea amidolyase family protein [Microbacterium yannicii]